MPMRDRTEIEKAIDIIEDEIADIDPRLLQLLLVDKTTGENLLWCTTDYVDYGPEYDEHSQMKVELITNELSTVIQPRAAKSKEIQLNRIKKRAEVFTPSWICNEQNNLVDEAWFGRKNVFNKPNGQTWKTNTAKIKFNDKNKTWKDYVLSNRLEITCGEAPYLVSRYDTTTGEFIPVLKRIGILDRKLRVVNENCETDKEWLEWSKKAFQSTYGYEFQGDSVLIARENLLYDYIDFFRERFNREPKYKELKPIAEIIAWNIWQMDGLKGVVPYSCHDAVVEDDQINLFGNDVKVVQCYGCQRDSINEHNGIYCNIKDWQTNKTIKFVSLMGRV